LETPVDPSTLDLAAPLPPGEVDKFVQSLNGLKPSGTETGRSFHGKSNISEGESIRPSRMIGTDNLRDRRFEHDEVTTTAPSSVLDQIKAMSNSLPAHDIKDDGSDSEMGG
jgi:hypothetical protein